MNPRERTLQHLSRLRAVALSTVAGAGASACVGYKVVDPMPGPDTSGEVDPLWMSVTATATWTSGGNVMVTVNAPVEVSEPSATGGLVLGGSLGLNQWSGEVQPLDGSTSIVLSFNLVDGGSAAGVAVVTLDVTGTPSTGEIVPSVVSGG